MSAPVKARLYHLTREESALGDTVAGPRHGSAAGAAPVAGLRVTLQRGGAQPRGPVKPDDDMPFAAGAMDDGFGTLNLTSATARESTQPPQPVASSRDAAIDDAAIAAVRAENLTARQIRAAEQIALTYGIAFQSPEEAVIKVRARGVDPFNRRSLHEAIRLRAEAEKAAADAARIQAEAEAEAEAKAARGGPVATSSGGDDGARPASGQALARITPEKLPARSPGREIGPQRNLPSREQMTEDRRAAEIREIQRDIARRRRRRSLMLALRLFLLIGIPTMIAGWYFAFVATPLYSTHSQFLIQIPEGSKSQVSGNIFTTSPVLTNTDSIAVQAYLTSRDAMLRLDKEMGFRRAFQDPSLDPLIRLSPDASNEETFKLYTRLVKIGYDPTEGVITMDVVAPDPKLSQDFSLALLRYAEGKVDSMSARLREDQMKGAMDSYDRAEKNVLEAQGRLQDLQKKLGILDPKSEGAGYIARINGLEGELTKKRLELGQLQSNLQPNASRVAGVQGDISRIEGMINEIRVQMTADSDNRDSLAVIMGEVKLAESDIETRQKLLMTAAEQVDSARTEANKQVRYLSLSVAPVPPDRPTFPKVFENTLVAFFILCGIYLMMSLTVSILREQVST